jgi:hypothetical protein
MSSPTQHSLALLRRSGFTAAVVEKWVPIPGKSIRRDLFGFADLLGFHPVQQTFLLVQTTTLTNLSTRLARVQARPEAALWIRAGGMVEVRGWAKRAGKWRVKRVAVTGETLATQTIVSPPRRQGGRRRDPETKKAGEKFSPARGVVQTPPASPQNNQQPIFAKRGVRCNDSVDPDGRGTPRPLSAVAPRRTAALPSGGRRRSGPARRRCSNDATR